MKTIFKGINNLNEELGELQQVIGKLHAYPTGEHPDGKGHLYIRLEEEIADVLAAIGHVIDNNLEVSLDKITKRVEEKMDLFDSWDMSGINVDMSQ
jgi:NTP pyrophosphatase (non-canonical NTP hydrolase)